MIVTVIVQPTAGSPAEVYTLQVDGDLKMFLPTLLKGDFELVAQDISRMELDIGARHIGAANDWR